jgi:hypothetical protein
MSVIARERESDRGRVVLRGEAEEKFETYGEYTTVVTVVLLRYVLIPPLKSSAM